MSLLVAVLVVGSAVIAVGNAANSDSTSGGGSIIAMVGDGV